jgi:hypothetical protein
MVHFLQANISKMSIGYIKKYKFITSLEFGTGDEREMEVETREVKHLERSIRWLREKIETNEGILIKYQEIYRNWQKDEQKVLPENKEKILYLERRIKQYQQSFCEWSETEKGKDRTFQLNKTKNILLRYWKEAAEFDPDKRLGLKIAEFIMEGKDSVISPGEYNTAANYCCHFPTFLSKRIKDIEYAISLYGKNLSRYEKIEKIITKKVALREAYTNYIEENKLDIELKSLDDYYKVNAIHHFETLLSKKNQISFPTHMFKKVFSKCDGSLEVVRQGDKFVGSCSCGGIKLEDSKVPRNLKVYNIVDNPNGLV